MKHLKSSTIVIDMQGDRGLRRPAFQVLKPEGEVTSDAERPPAEKIVTQRTFGPRQPGKADITVKETREDKSERIETVELLIEETYVGAIRVGIAAVGFGAVDRSYDARAVGGSAQSEVVATGTSDVDFELVLGAVPYLFTAPRPSVNTKPWLAPYFGIGLVSVDAEEDADLEFLKSLHVGVELEFVPSFSVAATGVARRVTRLADGVHIGSAVDGDVPTETTVGFGGALVINFTPEFMKIASSGSGGIL